MIEIRDVSVRFAADAAPALDGVSLTFRPGELVALVGANGSGKSTLASLLCALRLSASGLVVVEGIDPACDAASRREVRRLVGLVRQHPADQLVSSVVFDEVAFGPRNLGLSRDEIRRRVTRAIATVGLSDALHADVSTLSGGQQQLLAIAGVLAMEPSYLVLDEASSMLDASARPAHRALLDHIAHEGGAGVIQVTHDPLEVLASDRVIVLDAGRVAFDGLPRELLVECAALWDASLVQSSSVEALRAILRLGYEPEAIAAPLDPSKAVMWLLDAYRAGAVPVSDVQAVADMLVPARLQSDVLAGLPLELSDVAFSYGAGMRALAGITFGAQAGEVVLVAGASGSGKSTLACVASGLYTPDAGTVRVCGHAPKTGDVGVAFQRPEDQLFCETVRDELAFAPRNLGCSEGEVRTRCVHAAKLVGIEDDLLDRYPFELSGGQARRVAIASILALDASTYILDEPTAGLDAAGRARLHGLARACAQAGSAAIVISHDLDEWMSEVDRVVLMAQGSVVWEGEPCVLARDADAFVRAGLRPPLSCELLQMLSAATEGVDAR